MTVEFRREFPGLAPQVSAARRWLDGLLVRQCPDIPDDTAAAAVLLLSEVATNALRHTASGRGGTFAVVAQVRSGWLRVHVEDAGGAIGRPRLAAPRCDAEGGRGLALVAAFADRWGRLEPGPGVYFALGWRVPQRAGRG